VRAIVDLSLEAKMNASVYSADRATYLRIVIVALLASIAIVGFAISARISDAGSAQAMTGSYRVRAELPNHSAAITAPARQLPARPI
jgi:hypothetical protein